MSLQHQHHLAENAALAECQSLIQEAAEGWRTTGRAAGQSCQAALQQAGQEYMHAATRHLYYQRALLQLLLRQLTFCVSELQGTSKLILPHFCLVSPGGTHSGHAGFLPTYCEFATASLPASAMKFTARMLDAIKPPVPVHVGIHNWREACPVSITLSGWDYL